MITYKCNREKIVKIIFFMQSLTLKAIQLKINCLFYEYI